jgi:hypothetical protein
MGRWGEGQQFFFPPLGPQPLSPPLLTDWYEKAAVYIRSATGDTGTFDTGTLGLVELGKEATPIKYTLYGRHRNGKRSANQNSVGDGDAADWS